MGKQEVPFGLARASELSADFGLFLTSMSKKISCILRRFPSLRREKKTGTSIGNLLINKKISRIFSEKTEFRICANLRFSQKKYAGQTDGKSEIRKKPAPVHSFKNGKTPSTQRAKSGSLSNASALLAGSIWRLRKEPSGHFFKTEITRSGYR